MRGRRPKVGMTLIEVLVVLALLGLITTMLAGWLAALWRASLGARRAAQQQ